MTPVISIPLIRVITCVLIEIKVYLALRRFINKEQYFSAQTFANNELLNRRHF